MKIKRIVLSLFAGVMLAGIFGFAALAEGENVAMLAGTETYFENLGDAFTQEHNPEGKSIILLKSCEQDVDVTSGGAYTFYLKGFTITGTFKTTNGTVHINGGAEMDGGAFGTLQNTGLDGNYPLYNNQTSGGNNLDIKDCNIIATAENGIAIYGVGEKTNITLANVEGAVKAEDGGLINIYDGTYNSDIIEENGTINISGGTFSVDPSAFISVGYAVVSENGSFKVKEELTVTVDEAFAKDEDGAYLLEDAGDVALFRLLINVQNPKVAFSGKTFKLTTNIDFEGATLPVVCDDSHRFGGTFDGQGNTISNFVIDGEGEDNVGFFGLTYGATIKNVIFENATVSGGNYTGVAVGFSRTSATTSFDNVTVKGDTTVKGKGEVAGLIGGGQVNVTDCEVTDAKISGSIDVAGLIGLVSSGSSEISGNTVSGVDIASSGGLVGGVAGRVISNGLDFSDNGIDDVEIDVADGASYADNCGLIFGAVQINDGGELVVTENTASNSTLTVAGVKKTDLYVTTNYDGSANDTGVVIYVAKVGDTYYASLQDAFNNASNNGTVKLVSDVVITTEDKLNWNGDTYYSIGVKGNVTLDLAGYKIIGNAGSDANHYALLCYQAKSPNVFTITDSTATASLAADASSIAGGAIINDPALTKAGKFSNVLYNNGAVVIDGGTLYNAETKNGNLAYAIESVTVGTTALTINGGAVISEDSVAVRVLSQGSTGTQTAQINGGKIKGNVYVILKNSGGNDTVSFAMTNGTIDGDLKILKYTAPSENATVDTVTVSGGTITGEIVKYGDLEDAEITLNASSFPMYAIDEITLEFEATETDARGEMLYNINLVVDNEKIINRLNSADLTFVLTQVSGKNQYEIIASNPEIAINPVDNSDDRYEFHYKNKDDVATDTSNVITIGQVKFTGYGKFSFAVDAQATTNAAHATTLIDNIVDTFVPGGKLEDGTEVGEFDVSDNTITDIEIFAPTQNLTINVSFPNSIENNGKGYQAMNILVTGEDITDISIDLGTDNQGEALELTNKNNAAYTVTFDKENCVYTVVISNALTANTSYNVTVSGAGYRTARYTVNTQETNKTLNFWNNVKDNAIEVEEDKASSATTTTFLAGDIVKDNEINIYDLSAVVSYFGEIDLDTTPGAEKYVKYDLNRDGKIDSKDVAYVLVSWGE